MATGRLSLAQQLAQLEQATPVDFDPEDLRINERGSDDEGGDTNAAAREHYFEVGPSSLRKLRDSVADPKYEGVRVSRKKLMEFDDEDEEGDESEEGEDQDMEGKDQDVDEEEGGEDDDESIVEGGQEPSESEADEELDGENEDEEEDVEHRPISSVTKRKVREEKDNGKVDDLKTTLQKTREEDLKKGKAVVRQLGVWDTLLDARIRLQKTVTTVNKMMSSDSHSLVQSSECEEDLQKYLEESLLLSEDIFELQEILLNLNEITPPPPRKKRRIQEDDTVDTYASYFVEASSSTAKLDQAIHPWLSQTLAKWSTKIQAVAPSVLLPSNRNAFSDKSQGIKSAVQLVDEVLLDHPRLLAKTQVLRGQARSETVDGKEEDPEMFDDTDFYQQMLRDVIESRGDGAEGADDWMALQKEKKAKKKVDTKASKGRKLRYEVHEKLQNFMVPVPVVGAWHEEQIDELFASLLGKGFENAAGDDEPDTTAEVAEAIREGFRVFG